MIDSFCNFLILTFCSDLTNLFYTLVDFVAIIHWVTNTSSWFFFLISNKRIFVCSSYILDPEWREM